jgi:serine/threonine-protein kinase
VDVLDGRYKILARLGEGGMGAVYAALDMTSGERVAVKTLAEDHESPHARERFEREARALFALEHPHVVAIRDFGIADGTAYLVTELLEGMTLEELIDTGGPPPLDLAAELSRQLLTALAFAHAQGVVHRDLKAANVIALPVPGDRYHAKLLDFGLVRFLDTEQWGAGAALTQQGVVFGSPGYISPEQTLGQGGDARSDVYSAGVLLFELFTGSWPFLEEDRVRMFRAHLAAPIPSLASTRADARFCPELEALVRKAMAKSPLDRFPDAVAFLTAFEDLPTPPAW